MSEWKNFCLGNVVTFQRGYDLPKSKMINGVYPVIGSNGIIGWHNQFTTENPSITLGRSGNVGQPFIYYGKSWSHNTTLFIKEFKNVYPQFIYYLLKTLNLNHYAGGTAVPTLNRNHIKNLPIKLPPLEAQKKIAAVLSALDDKIELNNAINKNLEEQAQAIYKSWFIDFEPFGGTMPDDWRQGRVEEIVVFHDSKRIPLSANERKKMKKIYPYYGATSIIDYVEDYIFNGIFLLFAEDGTVIDDKGFPILQYVEGKFWVNNHAHILTGQLGFSVETLYLLFKIMNINSIITGAVQQKVSQSNLKRVPVVIASYKDLIEFDKIISPMFEMIRGLRTENQKLGELRDALLPKLMSGEIDVSEVEI